MAGCRGHTGGSHFQYIHNRIVTCNGTVDIEICTYTIWSEMTVVDNCQYNKS